MLASKYREDATLAPTEKTWQVKHSILLVPPSICRMYMHPTHPGAKDIMPSVRAGKGRDVGQNRHHVSA